MNEGENEGEGDDTIGEYDGERNEVKQRHGKGRALLPNSDYFSGSYKEGLREGKGHYVFKGGAQYRGDYKNGMKDGVGIFFYPDGSTYEGDFREDKRHGKGKYTYAQGDVYDGDWEKDERQGLGTYTYKASGVVMFGIWKNGKMEGRGKISYPTFTFHGTFLHNMPIGKGCFVFENYCIQQGIYVHVKDKTVPPLMEEGEEIVGEEDEKLSPREGYPKGIIPTWRPRKVLPYNTALIPPDPKLPPKGPPPEDPDENPEVVEEPTTEGETLQGTQEGERRSLLSQSANVEKSSLKSEDVQRRKSDVEFGVKQEKEPSVGSKEKEQ